MPNIGARDTVIKLCNCYDMDLNHQHIPLFKSLETQRAFFDSRTKFKLDDTSYKRKYNSLKVDKTIEDLKWVNYVVALNSNGEHYYYFVTDKVMLSENSSMLILKLDVMQTYMFDFDLQSCLIERQHEDRWYYVNGKRKPNFSRVEENLEVGEYDLIRPNTVYDYTNKGVYFITSSDMLGVSDDERPKKDDGEEGGGEGGGGEGGNNYKVGYCDKNGLKFIKSVEGYARVPYDIGDGTRTTGYGVTEVWQKQYFDRLLPECTEQEASVVLGEVLHNFSGTVFSELNDAQYNMANMTQGLFNAMTSFAYNSGNITTFGIWDMILANDSKESIATAWETTNIMPGTEFEQGLRNRRKKEADMVRGTFNYESLVINNVTDGGTVSGYGYVPEAYK